MLALLATQGLTVEELAVNNSGGGKARFRDGTKQNDERIAGLIGQLEYRRAFAYLLERERTLSKYGPLLIAWHADHREASENELDTPLTLRASGRTWPRSHGDWALIHVTHSFGTDATYASGIRHRLDIPPKSSRQISH